MIKQIKNFENYTIDENGNVINIKTNHIKIPTSNQTGKGYLYVDLYNNGKRKREYIHRLVAKAFIQNPENKSYINHIDGDTHNNNIKNLEWCTPLENVIHASTVINTMHQYKLANERRKKPVSQIECFSGKLINKFESVQEASRYTHIPSSNIIAVLKNRQSRTKKYLWQYIEKI